MAGTAQGDHTATLLARVLIAGGDTNSSRIDAKWMTLLCSVWPPVEGGVETILYREISIPDVF